MTTSLPAMALPRCFACGMGCEAVSHAWRDRLPRSPCGSKQNKYNHQEPYSIGGRNSTTRSDTQPKSDSAQHNRITESWNHRVYPNRIKWFRRVIKTGQTPKLRARSGGETGQPDRCVYASVSQERRNLPELGRATSGFLYPLRCRVPLSSAMLLSSKGIGRKTQYLHREPYSIGGRNSTTRLDTQPKSDWRPNQHNTIEQNEN